MYERCEQRDRIEIKHRQCLWMIAGLHPIAAEAHEVADAIAAHPRMSPWIAIRLRSRQEICITGA